MTTKQCILGQSSILSTKWKGGFFSIFLEEQVCLIFHTFKSWLPFLYDFLLLFLWSSCFEKDFGFVNRLLFIRLHHELGPRWTIFDNKGNVHHVTFNMDIYNPRIIEGWSDLRNFYHLKPPKLCYLRHTRNSAFEIYLYEHCSESNVHKFLSHVRTNAPLITSKLIHFEFRLSKKNCKSSLLVRFHDQTCCFLFYYSLLIPYFDFILFLLILFYRIWIHTYVNIFAIVNCQILCFMVQKHKVNASCW